MPFNRYRAQLRCEALVNSRNLADWHSKRDDFENLHLTADDASRLLQDLNEDSKDLFFKGLLSLSEAITSLNRHLFSWATIKLYYSVFYFLKCSLAVRGHAVVRNKSLYLLTAGKGSKPTKKSADRYRNDHVGVINIYNEMFENSDKLQSNTIEGENPYLWLMEKRNRTHYREREFHDPFCANFLRLIAEHVDKGSLYKLLSSYVEDPDFIYCFQEDHACLALPIKRSLLTRKDLADSKIVLNLAAEKLLLLKELLSIQPELTVQLIS